MMQIIKEKLEIDEVLEKKINNLLKSNKIKAKLEQGSMNLKEENLSLRQSLSFWKDKFLKVISFIKDKLFGKEKDDFDMEV